MTAGSAAEELRPGHAAGRRPAARCAGRGGCRRPRPNPRDRGVRARDPARRTQPSATASRTPIRPSRSRGTCPATAGSARTWRSRSAAGESGRGGRPRAGAAGSASRRRSPCGARRDLARAATGQRSARAALRRRLASACLEVRRRLVAVERPALDGDDRPRVEARVHPHERDARSRGHRRGSWPGSGPRRDAAAAATDGGSGCRRRQVEEALGHDLAVVGEDDRGRDRSARDLLDGLGVAQARRLERGQAELPRADAPTGVGRGSPLRPAGRSGAVTTADESTSSGCRGEAPRGSGRRTRR